jgi:ABC-type branched-subunit amino acid transport system ATPase component
MSFEALVPPPPGSVTAVVPGPDDGRAEALSPVLADAAAAGRAHRVVPAAPVGARGLTTAVNLRASAALPGGAEREAWLRPLPELVARLDRPWHELGHAERYLADVARARLAPVDLLVLELPGSRLAGPRVLTLIADLAAEGVGILWLERRLRLVASFAIAAWLLDAGELVGPLDATALEHDARARRLAFGGRLGER